MLTQGNIKRKDRIHVFYFHYAQLFGYLTLFTFILIEHLQRSHRWFFFLTCSCRLSYQGEFRKAYHTAPTFSVLKLPFYWLFWNHRLSVKSPSFLPWEHVHIYSFTDSCLYLSLIPSQSFLSCAWSSPTGFLSILWPSFNLEMASHSVRLTDLQ